jgi:hypothetical protein
MPEQAESPDGDKPDATADDDAERHFVDDLVVRGEVVPAGTEPLPAGVTHEYVEDGEGRPRTVRRRRFSVDPGHGT